jgi:hypothetical protein
MIVRKLLSILITLFAIEGHAAVQDYQVIRLVAMKSDCIKNDLLRTERSDGSIEFFISCKNLSHYPDGLQVTCSNVEDERSCKIKTEAKQFNNLKLLQSAE